MLFKVIKPSERLAKYIKYYWVMETGNEISGSVSDRVIPTGNCELMFHSGNPFKITDEYNNTSLQPHFFLCGQKNTYYDAATVGNTGLLSVTFKPHGARLFFDVPLDELQNTNLSLDDFMGKEGKEIGYKIAEAKTYKIKISILEKFLFKRIQENKLFEFEMFDAAFNSVNKHTFIPSVDKLAKITCLSSRQLERKFLDIIGLSPKQFLRIQRFQKVIQLKRLGNKNNNLTQLAFEAGYYDQSHFIREFKLYSGYSPKEFFTIECNEPEVSYE